MSEVEFTFFSGKDALEECVELASDIVVGRYMRSPGLIRIALILKYENSTKLPDGQRTEGVQGPQDCLLSPPLSRQRDVFQNSKSNLCRGTWRQNVQQL